MPEEETLLELQRAKSALEARATALRQVLHKLCSERPEDWQSWFAEVQEELIVVVTSIGKLESRIRTLVEGENVEEAGHDA
jgi:hypothetical protein